MVFYTWSNFRLLFGASIIYPALIAANAIQTAFLLDIAPPSVEASIITSASESSRFLLSCPTAIPKDDPAKICRRALIAPSFAKQSGTWITVRITQTTGLT
jgi:hypothetical protein